MRSRFLTFLLTAIVVLSGALASAQTSITTTTLASAVNATQTTIQVASATGITANTTVLFLGGAEFVTVNAVNGTNISVTRVQRGLTHNSSATVWVVPNAATVAVNPKGSCTRGTGLAAYTLTFNMSTGDISACRLGVLVASEYNWRTVNAYDPGTPSYAPPQTP